MPRPNHVPDRTISQQVNQRLGRSGLDSQCKITAAVSNGCVTFSGNLQCEMHRRNALRAASGIEGVRGVVDLLQVKPREHKWQTMPNARPGAVS